MFFPYKSLSKSQILLFMKAVNIPSLPPSMHVQIFFCIFGDNFRSKLNPSNLENVCRLCLSKIAFYRSFLSIMTAKEQCFQLNGTQR